MLRYTGFAKKIRQSRPRKVLSVEEAAEFAKKHPGTPFPARSTYGQFRKPPRTGPMAFSRQTTWLGLDILAIQRPLLLVLTYQFDRLADLSY